VEQVFQSVARSCGQSKDCSFMGIANNAKNHAFELTHVFSSMVDLVQNEHITSADTFYENMNEVGMDMAELITALLNI